MFKSDTFTPDMNRPMSPTASSSAREPAGVSASLEATLVALQEQIEAASARNRELSAEIQRRRQAGARSGASAGSSRLRDITINGPCDDPQTPDVVELCSGKKLPKDQPITDGRDPGPGPTGGKPHTSPPDRVVPIIPLELLDRLRGVVDRLQALEDEYSQHTTELAGLMDRL